MDQLPLTLPDQATSRRRGRPPGARNRASGDLAKYVAAQFAGLTPGQVMAQIALPTAKEVKRARADARELQIVDLGVDQVTLALIVKATKLGRALGVTRAEAWAAMMKEREGLMSYIHPKQSPAPPVKPGTQAVGFIIPEGQDSPAPMLDLGDDDGLEIIEQSPVERAQVGRAKSDDAP